MQENIQEKSPIKRKILLYLKLKGISQYQFYRKTGITRGVLGQDNGISEDNVSRFLAHYTDISPDWLLTGNGPMLRETKSTEIQKMLDVEGVGNADLQNKDNENQESTQVDSSLIDKFFQQIKEKDQRIEALIEKVARLQVLLEVERGGKKSTTWM